ncbi:Predicted thioesterase [Sporolituus thermophilus DSM 23256]|uniref:Predicted thioesterase n=1 Tax=Sporolituus thermophilus DSM 23256 TaxID=1123285 RepID=A0A1G7IWX4_9FIRM|nr:Predicted thioesterase [Sporolituus thermophilus DSM 23256]
MAVAQTLTVGLKGEATIKVTPDNTAERFGNAGAAVFATPMLVALMEQAAIAAVANCLAPGEGTVGTRVDMHHLAATPVGMTVRATAELVEVAGKRLVFTVAAYDDREKVGEGRHERYIIRTASFLEKVAAKAGSGI